MDDEKKDLEHHIESLKKRRDSLIMEIADIEFGYKIKLRKLKESWKTQLKNIH